ncbi:MAG: hypothetical protein L3K15_01475 [Thermoplasmata archaeon]|nr:hypothetical protein [Thermoplasmata archaeon]
MTDLQESPAVPHVDEGGDERLGYLVGGGLLIGIGWGVAVLLNLLLHAAAGSGTILIGQSRIGSPLGPYAQATLAFGLFTGLVGVVLVLWGRAGAPGPFVLPGPSYPWPGDGAATESPSAATGASGHP